MERVPAGTKMHVSVGRKDSVIEIMFGEPDKETRFTEPFSQETAHAPWRFGLFLTMAYNKIMADHGAKIFVNRTDNSMLPLKIGLQQGPDNLTGTI